MSAWLLAASGGVLLSALQYVVRGRLAGPVSAGAAIARALALTLLLALLLDAPAGRGRPRAPLVALDASASWLRATDTSAWRSALGAAADATSDSVLLFGDSVRAASPLPTVPLDHSTRLRPAVDRAAAAGRPLLVITDGELTDPDALDALPPGSRVRVIGRPPRPDLAVTGMDVPGAAVGGDTIDVRVSVRAGAAGAPAGTLALLLDDARLAQLRTAPLTAYADAAIPLRVVVRGEGSRVLRAVLAVTGDSEPRNDTLGVPLELSRAAGAVFASTAPDQDARFALTVLRGALSVPTRGYFRVAPGRWRVDGALAAVEEAEVRRALLGAPLAVIHGDTAALGDPRRATSGALALVAPPITEDGEFFATAAPPSPLAGALSGVLWDSLPPLAVSAGLRGDWVGLQTRRARTQEARPAIVGSEGSRRVVVVGAAGLWRWRFRAGTSADAHAAVWGSVFDWLLAGRGDPRAAVPPDGVLRAGQPIRWHKGSLPDSLVRVQLRRRSAGRGSESPRTDSMVLRFGGGATFADGQPLDAGVYDVRVPGGTAVLVVNASREWLPMTPTVRDGSATRTPARTEDAPRLRARWWPWMAFVLLLCAEWLLRRRAGLR